MLGNPVHARLETDMAEFEERFLAYDEHDMARKDPEGNWRRRERKREADRRYNASEKGRVTNQHYECSDKGRVARAAYAGSDTRWESWSNYDSSVKGVLRRARFEAQRAKMAHEVAYAQLVASLADHGLDRTLITCLDEQTADPRSSA